jgi:hypothetical protein
MGHKCHAVGCQKVIPPRLLMCLKHWRMVPKEMQADIWKTYVPGQEVTKTPTNEYLKAQQRAVAVVLIEERGIPIEEAIKIVCGFCQCKKPALLVDKTWCFGCRKPTGMV